ncbi:MAG: 7TM diverse intracellular signaling domain-containing protein, partial [Pseudomonadota bacterium]
MAAGLRVLTLTTAFFVTLLASIATAQPSNPIEVSHLSGSVFLAPGYRTWHHEDGDSTLADAIAALADEQFGPPPVNIDRGSTGLLPGSLWAHFTLANAAETAITVHLEYVDHQLLYLRAYQRSGAADFVPLADLAMEQPFDQRLVAHPRLVIPATVGPGESMELLVQYESNVDGGFVFPNLRVWAPEVLRQQQSLETAGMAVVLGGILMMAVVAVVIGVATGDRIFYGYSIYALSKITVWATVLGFTHQFLLRDHFDWHYMSIAGAFSIIAGTWFARAFLQSRKHLPRFDYALIVMLVNAAVLVFAAVAGLTTLEVLSITLALLMYPLIVVAALLRWRQGSQEALVFA